MVENYEMIQRSLDAFRKAREAELRQIYVSGAVAANNYKNIIDDNYKTLAALSAVSPNIDKYAMPSMEKIRAVNLLNLKMLGLANYEGIKNSLESHITTRKFAETAQTALQSHLATASMGVAAQAALQSHLAKIAQISFASEHYLSKTRAVQIGAALHMSQFESNNIIQAHDSFINSYSEHRKTIVKDLGNYITLPKCLSYLPTIEVYTSNRIIERVSRTEKDKTELLENEIREETFTELETLLGNINGNFINMWQGAISAASSNNPDRVRHTLISLRELFTQIIHQLAPDENIKTWSDDQKYYKDGKPTRDARLKYMCRSYGSKPFEEFMECDVKTFLSYFNILQRVHDLNLAASNQQLDAFILRVGTILRFIIVTNNATV